MNNSKVSTRLAIGFGSVLFLLVTVALVGFYGLSSIHSRLDSIARVNNDESKY
ncbi:MCP four helix bundle domain-containing protein, partial [Robbsia andropogonis]